MPLQRDHPTLPHGHWLWHAIHRNLGRTPRWTFPDTLLGSSIRLQRLHIDNYDNLWPLLAQGDTTFVDREYRERQGLYEQTLMLHGNLVYTGANGAVDYLVVNTPGTNTNQEYGERNLWGSSHHLQLADTEQLAGVVHLYELSHERIGHGMHNPLIGIQIGEAYRGTGIADRALDVLEWYVDQTYPEATAVTAMIERENTRSIRFFERRGYGTTSAYGDPIKDRKTIFLVKPLPGRIDAEEE